MPSLDDQKEDKMVKKAVDIKTFIKLQKKISVLQRTLFTK